MLFNSPVTLNWSDKHNYLDPAASVAEVLSSVVRPNPLYESNSLFEPLLHEGERTADPPRQRIIQGDNLSALRWLVSAGYSEKIDLIYIDPPYLSQSNYHSRVLLTDGKQKEWLQRDVFKDNGIADLPTYLNHLYLRLILMRELLSSTGSIFVHLDWHACHYVKILLDEIFGVDNFINEIVWCYSGGSGSKRHFHRKHDIILWYGKGNNYTFNPQFRNYSEGTVQRGLTRVKGDRFRLHEEGALLQDWWTDINKILSPTAYENLKFPTQKPTALLRRLIECASHPGGLIADFYAGSGTLAQVGEEAGRNWISCDNNNVAVNTMIYRLLEMRSRDFRLDIMKNSEEPDADQPGFEIDGPHFASAGKDGRWLEIGLKDYMPSMSDENKLKGDWAWPVLLDFWEIDTDYRGGCFNSCWQVIRPQHHQYDSNITTRVRIPVSCQDSYNLAVRVHDIFGNVILKRVDH